MHSLTTKIKNWSSRSKSDKTVDVPQVNMNEERYYRYRKQRGVNFGSWFVLERWITDDPFRYASEPGQSDLDVARGHHARKVLEAHWDSWVVEADWKWVAEHGMNSVRIPIGYYHLCGIDSAVLHNTDFHNFGHVFSGAWSRITRAIETAHKYGIGVLIDLHAAPGKQNNDSHSGTSLQSTFFSRESNRQHTTRILETLLHALKHHTPPLPNIIGIELINEPHPPSDSSLQKWYKSAITSLRRIDPDIPIIIGECWRPDTYAEFIATQMESELSKGPVILDHHLYRCFTSSDISASAAAHTSALTEANAATPLTFSRVSERAERAGGGLIVGEWSGALNPGSRRGDDREVAAFVRAQLDLYERWCAGWYWWTYKKKVGWRDTGWSLRNAVESGVFPAWVGLKPRSGYMSDSNERSACRDDAAQQALNRHSEYWSRYPGKYDHQRFEEGFKKGWDAGYLFIDGDLSGNGTSDQTKRLTVSQLGFRGAYARQLTGDHGRTYWEFEHGFFQGVDAATCHFETGSNS